MEKILIYFMVYLFVMEIECYVVMPPVRVLGDAGNEDTVFADSKELDLVTPNSVKLETRGGIIVGNCPENYTQVFGKYCLPENYEDYENQPNKDE